MVVDMHSWSAISVVVGVVLTVVVVLTDGIVVFRESDDFDLVKSEKPIFLYLF